MIFHPPPINNDNGYNTNNDNNLEFYEFNFELCLLMGVGILIHMFMSKHVIFHNTSILWAMIIATEISLFVVFSLSKFGFFPLFESRFIFEKKNYYNCCYLNYLLLTTTI